VLPWFLDHQAAQTDFGRPTACCMEKEEAKKPPFLAIDHGVHLSLSRLALCWVCAEPCPDRRHDP
jgi:hypothetical protein